MFDFDLASDSIMVIPKSIYFCKVKGHLGVSTPKRSAHQTYIIILLLAGFECFTLTNLFRDQTPFGRQKKPKQGQSHLKTLSVKDLFTVKL